MNVGTIRATLILDTKSFHASLRNAAEGVLKLSAPINVVAAQGSVGFGKLTTSIGAATTAALGLLRMVDVLQDSIQGVFTFGVQSVESFQRSVIGIAAGIVSLDKSVTAANIEGKLAEATQYARSLYDQILLLDAQFSGTAEELFEITRALAQHGILIDLNAQKQREALRGFAEAIKALAPGLNVQLQATQAIRAILTGIRDEMDQVVRGLGLAGKEGDELRKRLAAAKDATERASIFMEALRSRSQGFVAAGRMMQNTLEASLSTLKTALQILARNVFADFWQRVVNVVQRFVLTIRDAEGNLTPLAQQLQERMRPALERIADAADQFLNLIIQHGPTIVDLIGQMADAASRLAKFLADASAWAITLRERMQGARRWFEELEARIPKAETFLAFLAVRNRFLASLLLSMTAPGSLLIPKSAGAPGRPAPAEGPLEVPPGMRGPTRPPAFDLRALSQEAEGRRKINEELQRQLRLHELLTIRQNWSLQQQLADLRRIRDAYAKTADERLELDIRIARLERQIEEQTYEKRIEASLTFIERKKALNEMSLEDEIAALERALQHTRANTKQREEVERRLFDARARLRRREVEEEEKRQETLRRIAEREREVFARRLEEEEKLRRTGAEQARQVLETVERERDAKLRLLELEAELGVVTRERLLQEIESQARLFEQEGNLVAARERQVQALRLREELLRREIDQAQTMVQIADAHAEAERKVLQEQIDARKRLLALLPQTIEYEAVRLRLLKEIRDLEREIAEQAIRPDFLASMRAAMEEFMKSSFDWLQAWRSALDNATNAVAKFFRSIIIEGKNVFDSVYTLFTDLLNAILEEIIKFVAREAVQWLIRILGLGSGGVLQGLQLNVFGAQRGLVARGPVLALLAERPGLTEVVQPLPRGMQPEDLASIFRNLKEGMLGREPSVTVQYNAPVVLGNEKMLQMHVNEIAAAVRMARRQNHPLFRER